MGRYMELPKLRDHYFHIGVYSVRFKVFTVVTKSLVFLKTCGLKH